MSTNILQEFKMLKYNWILKGTCVFNLNTYFSFKRPLHYIKLFNM